MGWSRPPLVSDLEGKLIAFGDSNSATPGQNGTTVWPELMDAAYPLLTMSNSAAIGSATAAGLNAAKADIVYPQIDGGQPFNLVVIAAGTNDLAANVDAATIYADLTGMSSGCQAEGALTIITTVVHGAGYSGPQQTQRAALNALIMANTAGANGVADTSTAVGTAGAEFSDDYHMSNSGQTRFKNSVAAKAIQVVEAA